MNVLLLFIAENEFSRRIKFTTKKNPELRNRQRNVDLFIILVLLRTHTVLKFNINKL